MQQVWLDGRLVYSADDVVYRFDKTVALDRFTFRNFHGGSDARFAPGKTQHIWCARCSNSPSALFACCAITRCATPAGGPARRLRVHHSHGLHMEA